MEDELTLRDLYEVLARQRLLLIAAPLLCAVLAFVLSSLLPHQYQARAVIVVNVTATPPDQGPFNLDPKLLPSPGALLSAYQQAAPARLAQRWQSSARDISQNLRTDQDEQSASLSISATDRSPQGAQQRAASAASDFQQYVDGVVGTVLGASLQASASSLQAQISGDRQQVVQLRSLLKATPATLPGVGQATTRQQLQVAGTDPNYNLVSTVASNPANTLLNVRLAETQTRIVSEEATLSRITELLNSDSKLLTISRQLLQVSLLGAPTLPDKPQGLSALLLAVLVYLLALLLSVLGVLLHHAVRGPAAMPGGSRHLATGD